jgi:hypothetical protein
MPLIEAVTETPVKWAADRSIAGMRVDLKRGLGQFVLPPGTSLRSCEGFDIPAEVDIDRLGEMFRASIGLQLAFPFAIIAETSDEGRRLTVGTFGYHETAVMNRFWKEQGGRVNVRKSSGDDVIKLNGQPIEVLPIPVSDGQQVLFEGYKMLA